MDAWLITPGALETVKSAMTREISADMLKQFEASFGDGEFTGSRIMVKAGNTAQINIAGVLSKEPSWMLRYFGGGNTAYSEIIGAINEAERDPAIDNVIFSIDSPGGSTNGLTGAMDAIMNMTIPTKAVVSGMAASAAYGLASQADTIEATDRGATFGSIGVRVTCYVDDSMVDITSTNAPNKAPDVTTDDGKATVRAWLDQVEAVFIEDIAEGRGVEPDKVKSDFGQGGVFLAKDALSRGMIDTINENDRSQITIPGAANPPQEPNSMNLQELQAKHPELYKAVFDAGVASEKDRVSAHLTLGEACGDIKTAISAIEKGDALTASYQAQYMAAGMKNNQIGARQTDENVTAAAATLTPGATTPEADEKAFLAALKGD